MFENFPLVLAANRDEHFDRPSAAPAPIASEPKIIAGIDLRAGGTWLGVNDRGVVAGILNRRLNGEIQPGDLRSRGQLCLDLLNCRSSADAQAYLKNHRLRYNSFTAVVADGRHALVSYNDSDGTIIVMLLEPGLHVFSSAAQVDARSAKADRAYSLFARSAREGGPARSNSAEAIASLQPVLADHSPLPGSNDPADAICVHRESSGTVSSSILRFDKSLSRFECFYCDGPPCHNPFGAPLTLDMA